MLTECPHCLLRILPTENGRCPACGQRTADESPWASLRVAPCTSLPLYCCICNEPTSRIRKIKIGSVDRELDREKKQDTLGCMLSAVAILNPLALALRLVCS